ncbi:MAG: universal stress protein [Acidobacteriota bacterium]
MLHLDRILVPVDFSPPCAASARHAIGLAARFHSAIHILHVIESATQSPHPGEKESGPDWQTDGRHAAAQSALDRFVAREVAPRQATTILRYGDAAAEIVRYAREIDCSLIAIPTRGHGMLRRLLLGSVTAKVLHDAECPVWTGVHSESFSSTAPAEITSVLCAVDFSAGSTTVLRWAGQFASVYQAQLAIVHVLPAMHSSWRPALDRQARRTLEQLLLAEGVEGSARVEFGEVGESVAAAARSAGAHLIVVGRGGASAALGRLRSSTYSIIRESPCPVVSV